EVQPQGIAGPAQPPDAERWRCLHQNPENRWVQMQMQVAIDMVKRQASGLELVELRVDFASQLFAQAAPEKVAEAGAGGLAGELAARVDEAGDFCGRQGGMAAEQC